jgi:hypothetical protein
VLREALAVGVPAHPLPTFPAPLILPTDQVELLLRIELGVGTGQALVLEIVLGQESRQSGHDAVLDVGLEEEKDELRRAGPLERRQKSVPEGEGCPRLPGPPPRLEEFLPTVKRQVRRDRGRRQSRSGHGRLHAGSRLVVILFRNRRQIVTSLVLTVNELVRMERAE